MAMPFVHTVEEWNPRKALIQLEVHYLDIGTWLTVWHVLVDCLVEAT